MFFSTSLDVGFQTNKQSSIVALECLGTKGDTEQKPTAYP